jgi:1-acyl-sn-glycerol-3-phosphate acyltransferase
MSQTLEVKQPLAAAEADEKSALLERTWFQTCFYDFVRASSAIGLTLTFGLRTRGRNNVPREGPALLVSNHQSYLDPLIVGSASCRRLSFLARKSLFRNPFFGWAIRELQAFPLDQEGIGIEGLRSVIKLLDAGKAVLVFPEGERTPDGKMVSLQPGIHLLVKRTQAPVVPVGMVGAFDAWPRSRPFPLPAPAFLPPAPNTISVVVGKPLNAQMLLDMPKKAMIARVYDEIAQRMAEAEALRRTRGVLTS